MEKAIELIKTYEGIKDGNEMVPGLQPYICPTGHPTIGWGYKLRQYKSGLWEHPVTKAAIKDWKTVTISREEADRLVRIEATKIENTMRDVLPKLPASPQRDALISFAYNTGIGAFLDSTLKKKVAAQDFAGAAAEFDKWVWGEVGGKKVKLAGLIERRKAEKELFTQFE